MSDNSTIDKDATKEDIELTLPRVEVPISQFNPDTKMYWIGLPLDKLMPLDILLLLDSQKINIIGAHKQIALLRQKIMTQDKTAFNKMKDFLHIKK